MESMTKNRIRVLAICVNCKQEFAAVAYDVKRGKGKCCSLGCAAALAAKNREQRGSANNNWKGGKKKDKAKMLAERRNYVLANPEKAIAHRLAWNAIRAGTLKPMPCERCGKEKTDAHHDDYSKPLAVRWLCRAHHMQHHAEQPDNPARLTTHIQIFNRS